MIPVGVNTYCWGRRDGSMVKRLDRVPIWILAPMLYDSQLPVTLPPGYSISLFDLCGHLCVRMHTHTHTDSQTHHPDTNTKKISVIFHPSKFLFVCFWDEVSYVVRVALNFLSSHLHLRSLGLLMCVCDQTQDFLWDTGNQIQGFMYAKQVLYLNEPQASPLATF